MDSGIGFTMNTVYYPIAYLLPGSFGDSVKSELRQSDLTDDQRKNLDLNSTRIDRLFNLLRLSSTMAEAPQGPYSLLILRSQIQHWLSYFRGPLWNQWILWEAFPVLELGKEVYIKAAKVADKWCLRSSGLSIQGRLEGWCTAEDGTGVAKLKQKGTFTTYSFLINDLIADPSIFTPSRMKFATKFPEVYVCSTFLQGIPTPWTKVSLVRP